MQNKSKIGLKDIAALAKVSIGTVDRVVNNRGRVAPKTKQKVLEIMKELNYQPNILASVLSGNKVSRIAICLPEVENSSFWKQPLKGVQNAQMNHIHFPIEFEFYTFDRNSKFSFASTLQEIGSKGDTINGLVIAPLFQKVKDHRCHLHQKTQHIYLWLALKTHFVQQLNLDFGF